MSDLVMSISFILVIIIEFFVLLWYVTLIFKPIKDIIKIRLQRLTRVKKRLHRKKNRLIEKSKNKVSCIASISSLNIEIDKVDKEIEEYIEIID